MAQLDLLLINPSSRTRVYQSLANEFAAVENPVWAGLLASFCRNRGYSVEIIDAEAEQLTADEVAERVRYLSPTLTTVVVYGHQPSASTQLMTSVGAVCDAIKTLDASQPLLLVGGHVAALPVRTLREESADFVAAGEGFHTITSLIDSLQTSRSGFHHVPGLWYRSGDTVKVTSDKPIVADLEHEVPGITWDLLPVEKYRAHNWHCLGGHERQPYAAIYTTLGCPYHCSFCCIQAPFRSGEKAAGIKSTTNSYRFWSPDHVINHIDTLVNDYGVRNIKIADEMFVLNRRHVLGICDRIIERGYNLNIWAYARVDTVKEDMLDRLRQAGFTWLALGIEAGADEVRANVDKKIDQRDIFEIVHKIRNAGIHVIGNYIFGLPFDTQDTMQATLDLAVELNCEFANFYCAMAYPGSPLYQRALQQDVPLPRHWTGFSQHSKDCLPLPTEYLTARDVLDFRDSAFQTYYTNRTYLSKVENVFGSETVNHIRHMTSHRLERDLLNGNMDVPTVTLRPQQADKRSVKESLI